MPSVPRSRVLLSLSLSVLVLWTGLDRPAIAFIQVVSRFSTPGRFTYVVASCIPLAFSVWSLVLARSVAGDARDDEALAPWALVLATVAVAVSALVTVSTILVSTPGFGLRFTG